MKRFFVFCMIFYVLVFAVSCGGSKNDNVYDYPDEDSTESSGPDKDSATPDDATTDNDIADSDDSDTTSDNNDSDTTSDDTDTTEPDDDSDNSDTGITDNDTDTDSSDTTPDNDTDTDSGDTQPDNDSDTDTDNPEVTENHKISGFYQIGSNVSGIEAALYECSGTTKIASANTDNSGKYSFNADISATKTYCVKANGFASCFKGMNDHVANISEITNAALLIDENCADLRKSETEVRTYAKLGTGEWLGELDYTKLSGIKEGLGLLSSYLNTTDSKILSQKIAADVKKSENREFQKFFKGFRISADKHEVVIDTANPANNEIPLSIEGGSTKAAPGFKVIWTAMNQTAVNTIHKISSVNPGEYIVRAKLVYGGGDPIMISEDSSTFLYLLATITGTIDVSDMSKDISHYIDNGIYAVIPKNTVIKKNGNKVNKLTYSILSSGDGSQVSKIDFGPEGTTFDVDSLYFVYELGTVFGGDPIMLAATRTGSDGSNEVLQSAGGDPIMLAAAGDPIMFSAGGDPIMQIARSAGGDPIMQSAGGDPIMISAGGDPIMISSGGDPIMAGDPIMSTAAGDPIMLGTSSSVMVAKTGHFSGFLLNSASLPVSAADLITKWCGSYYYQGYSPLEFIRLGIERYKEEGVDKTDLLSYFNTASECAKLYELESDLYGLFNRQIGFQRNINLFENLYYVSEFYNHMLAKMANGEVAAVKNGLELRSAIAALFTSTDAYNRSSTLSDMFDSSKIPMTYSGSTPADYSSDAQKAVTGLNTIDSRYVLTKKEVMIFANYILTSSAGPDFSTVSSPLSPDKFICAWFNDTAPQNCNKVYTLNSNGHVALNGSEITLAEAEQIFAKFFMPMNSRLTNAEKLNLFRTYYLVLRYIGTIFDNDVNVAELNDKLLETAYRVFDGINKNKNAVSIVDTFDASAHTVQVLESGSMKTTPYINKLSTLTDKISLKVASPANVEKVLIKIEGYSYEKVFDNASFYYKPAGSLKEKAIVLAPGELAEGLKPLKTLLGSENIDELGDITGKMTVVVNSKVSDKTYSTQKTYEFLINENNEGVDSKPVPSDLSVFLADASGNQLPAASNPGIILNPGNRVLYPDESGLINIENLAPAAYTINAFAEGYYTKTTNVYVPENSTLSVEIRLDEEVTSSADAALKVKVRINTAKHPDKVYISIYDENIDLITRGEAVFEGSGYIDADFEIPSGRYTLLATGEEMYNYMEEITVYEGANTKEITVVAKNACGNGIIDSGEECEAAGEVRCGDIYPASTNPDNTTSCNPETCVYDKTSCGKRALCGDGVIDLPGEICDTKSRNCSEIPGFENARGVAPCDECARWVTEGNCSRTSESCGSKPANAVWNDGIGRFTQTNSGSATDWTPAAKSASFGTTKDECVFSCQKGYKWNGNNCVEHPLSLGNICTGQTDCFDNSSASSCPAYGEPLFGQDFQYANAGFCTWKSLTSNNSGNETTVIDDFTHYEWQQSASAEEMNWEDANQYCSDLNINSISTAQWRLPSPAELLTVVDSGAADPAIAGDFDTNGHTFWATGDARNAGKAWRTDANGSLGSVAKTENHSVLCVRVNSYDQTTDRFSETSETVKDHVSGLMWQKQFVSTKTWNEALSYCEEVTTDEKYDWRLPNRNELASLIDFEKTSGTASALEELPAHKFWTSTTSANAAGEAWTVDFATGSVGSAAKSEPKYVVCVRNDEKCFGDDCADPCIMDPCSNIENSTGSCSAEDGTFVCGCKSGFNWSSGKCILRTTRYTACTGLPDNAHWNTVFGISQSLDSNGNWRPSEVGEYNLTASTGECRFKCNTNYEWDSGEKKCNARTTLAECSNKPAKSEWNMVDNRIIQTWNGEAWEPSAKEPVFSEEECSDICCFKCIEHYQWNEEDKTCDPGTNEAECTDLKTNAEWWYGKDNVTQKWDDTQGWLPTSTGTYKSDVAEGTNGCFFKCIAHYKWNQGTQSCEPETITANCTIPANAVSTGTATISQTWDPEAGEHGGYQPSNIATYSETQNNDGCHFKCDNNYFYDGYKCMNPCRGSEDPCKYTPNAIEDTCEATAFNEYTCACKTSSETSLQYFWDDGKCLTANFGRICTGQDKCYNNNANSEQSCSSVGQSFSGQDAPYAQKGVCIPKDFQLKTLSNGTTVVADKNLSIIWQLTTDSTTRTWDEADTYCNNLNADGKSGWRLPSVKELLSIVDNSKDSNAAYEIFGSLPASPLFWSSKTYESYGINVSLETGESSRVAKSTKLSVRCVKGTKEGDGNFVQANVGGDTIVTDKTTGLIWYNNDNTVSWQNALSACENLVYAGFDDWRLPNKNELASLYKYDATGYGLNSEYPGMSTTKKSWSSTTIKKYNSLAWIVNFKSGIDGALKIDLSLQKSNDTDVSYMCVRTATCGAGKNWDGEKCVDPCDASGCGELENSNGVCRLETLNTTKCECNEGYEWIADEPSTTAYICGGHERTVNCVGLPEHAIWNTATQITQTLETVIKTDTDMWGNITYTEEGYKYTPTAQGSYNTTASENECRFKCESGYYWNNSSQCLNPCNPNPCSSLSGSNGACTATDATTYKCGCNSGYFWDTSRLSCRKPCDTNPCRNVNNSTGGCSNTNATSLNGYTCGCNTGYFWNGSYCQKSINLGKICTGQNQCYDNGNDPITCPADGENFFGQDYIYNPWKCSTKTFGIKETTISGQNIVLDQRTGLEWQQTIPSTGYTWSQANNYCNNLSYGNYSDWRLPTPKELFTIINDSTYAPATYTDYFPNTSSDANYWTSKKVAGNTSLAWTVSIRWGYTSSQSASSSQTAEGSYPIKVRCVRGETLPEGSFSTSTVNGDVIVNDSSTGLIWTKNYVTDKTWQQALKYCEDLTYANSGLWRLPNKNELISLVNYDKREPSTDFPDMTESRSFWTSTSRPNLPERAFDVYFLNGNIATQPKTGEKRAVICVKNQ